MRKIKEEEATAQQEEEIKEEEAMAQQEEEEQEEEAMTKQEEEKNEEEAVTKQEEEKKEQEAMANEEEQPAETEEDVILRRVDAGFETWLRSLSAEKLEQLVSRLMRGHENEKATKEYVDCVKSMEPLVRFCSKCRRSGCEKCDYVKSLRYVMRWQKPGDWWQREGHSAVMGTVRYLRGT